MFQEGKHSLPCQIVSYIKMKAKKVKGNKRLKFPGIKQVSHGDVIYNIGNTFNNIVIA